MVAKFCDERCQFFAGKFEDEVLCLFMETLVPPFLCNEWEEAEMLSSLLNIIT